jgi:hypothetical protein
MSKIDSETKKNYSNAHPSKIIDDDNIKLANKVIYMKTKIGPNRKTVFPIEIDGIKVTPGMGDLFKKQLEKAVKDIKLKNK